MNSNEGTSSATSPSNHISPQSPMSSGAVKPLECDVLVIGGGPAGSTSATLLAERGYKVTLLEKAHHPRFHIGESLLPANLPLLEKLGVAEKVKAIGMEKWGAQFVSPVHEHEQSIEFADAWDKTMPMSYQVKRADFDEILIRNASAKNAHVIEGCQVQEVVFLQDGKGARVQAKHDNGQIDTWNTRFVIDASGRDTFLGNRFKIKESNKKHNSTAVYAHFSGAARLEGKQAGDITIFWFDHGWFWYIPLSDGLTSIGAVTWPYYLKTRGQRSLEEFFKDTIAMCPRLAKRLENAKMETKVEATGNFSYLCERNHGENYLMLGDAFAFIDPVFSSGVMLAMQNAFDAAEAVDTCLRHPEQSAAALKKYDERARLGPKVFSWFIYRVTNPTMRDLFMNPANPFRVKEALLSVLAGDVYGKTPTGPSIFMLKVIYYTGSFLNMKRTFQAWRMRKKNIQLPKDGNLFTA